MKKHYDWQIRFEAFVRERRSMPFAWGTNDCAIFASDCVLALTGTDPAPASLRKHKTAKQGTRVVHRHGGLGVIATRALGDSKPVAFAQVGDVVLVMIGKREALGICNGQTAIGPSAAGIVAVPMDLATACWRIS